MSGSVKGWSYEIERGVCTLCGEVDSVLSSSGPGAVCEHCSSAAGMAWRRLAGEVPPGFPDEDVRRISTVSVLVARRKLAPDPLGAREPVGEPRMLPTAYEFLVVRAPDGESHVPPTCPLPSGMSVRDGAGRVLESVGLCSWPALLETLHVGYTPRGRLAAVVLARGYAARGVPSDNPGTWLPWPASAHAGRMAGSYEFLEATWPLRLYRLCVPGDRLPAEVTVPMREVARRFVELQSAVGAGGDVDSSMLSAYRSAMTADELAVAELVGKFEEEERRKVSRKCLPAVPPEEGGSGEAGDAGGTGGGDAVSDSGDGDSGDGDEGNDGEGGGDPPPEPGFARGFKRR